MLPHFPPLDPVPSQAVLSPAPMLVEADVFELRPDAVQAAEMIPPWNSKFFQMYGNKLRLGIAAPLVCRQPRP